MKKSILGILSAAVLATAFFGCSSVVPLQGNNTAATNQLKVLGRVTVERPTNKSGYTILWQEALKQYPEADDIINILVDGKKKSNGEQTYIMSALVVKYGN
ncbi:hypothetical protein [Treponema zioleckii]|uniref:hypothetical protein n=1 Tax=Treponema zioleckii TaxID=331680 RepID=UPI00168B8813|nr:hypothetical protein [Treponema zioleckii]